MFTVQSCNNNLVVYKYKWNISQKTLKIFPATYLLVVSVFYAGVLAILIYTHFGLKVFFGTHLANPALHSSIIEMFSVCISASPELRRHTDLEE